MTTLRNATVTCIAPTGTISLIAGTSSGIEPFFALAFARRILGGKTMIEIQPTVEKELASLGASGEIAFQALQTHGSVRRSTFLSIDLRRRFPIALEIPPEWHLRMQAAFQAHVDAGVSKTVNLPQDAPPSTVRKVFTLARHLNVKGVTVYRYGSREHQALSLVSDSLQSDCRECGV
jgi:ribonucleoside-diphosphate reductase alpha chain